MHSIITSLYRDFIELKSSKNIAVSLTLNLDYNKTHRNENFMDAPSNFYHIIIMI